MSGDRTDTKREMKKRKDDRMEEGACRGWLRATRPRSDRLRLTSPLYGGEGGSSGPIEKGEGRSKMEEGRGTTWESLERRVRGRGCEVWKMED